MAVVLGTSGWPQLALGGLLFVLLSGCQTMAPQHPAPISAPFDAVQAAKLVGEGVNIVRGSAFMRQVGGGVVTCAGGTVNLIPATKYAQERMVHLYGSTERGMSSRRALPLFSPNPPEYTALIKTTRCDAQGNFVFDRVADGVFYVQTTVTWGIPGQLMPEGGHLMQRISVEVGKPQNVILAP